ncbi:hypothetical protein BJ508DRAFT_411344 [Ascobolus immersus RN42]|uniref:Six-hairpin glycosidase n=1 Tax=Ascobolus immersus RN42 TaxID=1160509 RepID=A0A3N4IKF5_ASCIM|nr:hypothetical protein BJ508DRAFT_411344 [Ascobolus immersus RN42]
MTPTKIPPSVLNKYITATSSVYGPFPSFHPSTASSTLVWSPPPMPFGHNGRYLWNDAFGVINFITLFHETEEPAYLRYAEALASAVHRVLGRTRDGSDYLPGASQSNPLGGGLRIGKTEESGNDCDGQYFHYLTIWMFALNRLSRATREPEYNQMAIQLAQVAHRAFVHSKGSAHPRMVWKMDINLEKALVDSEGNLDPIDGLSVFKLLAHDAAAPPYGTHTDGREVLTEQIKDFERMVESKYKHFQSNDALDLGMTLWTTHFWAKDHWAKEVSKKAYKDLKKLDKEELNSSISLSHRLAFREFGAALGIKCNTANEPEDSLKDKADEIINTWEAYGLVPKPKKQLGKNEEQLAPITEVMYAAALWPGAFKVGYLGPEVTF